MLRDESSVARAFSTNDEKHEESKNLPITIPETWHGALEPSLSEWGIKMNHIKLCHKPI